MNSVYSYLFNKWKIALASIYADQILLVVQPLNADSLSGQASALKEFKVMLSVLEVEMTADQSIDVDNLSVQECTNIIIEKLGNRSDDFFEKYEFWQRRVPSSNTETIDLIH